MAELDRQGGARPPDFGRLSQSGGEDPVAKDKAAKDKGIYNICTIVHTKFPHIFSSPQHSDLDCRIVSKKDFKTSFLGQEYLIA